jgi:hypothetical protein
MALGSTQLPNQSVPEDFTTGVKQPGQEAHHSPPSIVEVKNGWSYIPTPPTRIHGVVLN